MGDLLRSGELVEAAETGEIHAAHRRPHGRVGLRGTGDGFSILDVIRGAVIGHIDGVRVLHECHPGAVYLHAGRQYLIEELDHGRRLALAAPADLDYYTTPLTEKDTEVLEVLAARRRGPLATRLARLKITERVVGFEKKRVAGQQVIEELPLELPPVVFETVGLWWVAPHTHELLLRRAGRHFAGSLHAAEHAAISLLPLVALCDRGDVGGMSFPYHPQVGSGAVFLYDGHPGGIGIAARTFAELPDLLARVLELLRTCPCEDGCPGACSPPSAATATARSTRPARRRRSSCCWRLPAAQILKPEHRSGGDVCPATPGTSPPPRPSHSPSPAAPASGSRASSNARASTSRAWT